MPIVLAVLGGDAPSFAYPFVIAVSEYFSSARSGLAIEAMIVFLSFPFFQKAFLVIHLCCN